MQELLEYPAGKIGSYIVPDGVTGIKRYAFSYSGGLTDVRIPNSVIGIGDHAFFNCTGLTDVALPDRLSTIWDATFLFCSSLTHITLPDSLTVIGRYAFADCAKLTSVTIPDSVAGISDWAFFECNSLTTVTLGKGLTALGIYPFSRCPKLTAVYARGNHPTGSTDVLWQSGDCCHSPMTYILPGNKSSWWNQFFPFPGPILFWLPQVQTADASFGVGTNGFGFNILWTSGMTVVVEASTNLTSPSWVPLATNTLAGN
jgi:hypothetical protein